MNTHLHHDPRFADLADQCRRALAARVLIFLREQGRAMTASQIARALNLTGAEQDIEGAAHDLAALGQVVIIGVGVEGRPLWRAVDTGDCEWCGLLSHQLVAGECPRCRDRFRLPQSVIREAARRRHQEEARHVDDHA